MAVPYNHREIEQKWRKIWEEHPVNVNDGKKPKYYCLDMFPYPSGNGLERIRYLRCLEQIQNAQWILSDSSDGMGCIRTSG